MEDEGLQNGMAQAFAPRRWSDGVASPVTVAPTGGSRLLSAEADDDSDGGAWGNLLPIGTVLDAEQWEWLHGVLDERIPDTSGLHKLLTEPGACG